MLRSVSTGIFNSEYVHAVQFSFPTTQQGTYERVPTPYTRFQKVHSDIIGLLPVVQADLSSDKG